MDTTVNVLPTIIVVLLLLSLMMEATENVVVELSGGVLDRAGSKRGIWGRKEVK